MTPKTTWAETREEIAAIQHEQWSGWMDYLFSKCLQPESKDGSLLIPPWAVKRWTRQMATKYSDLSNNEKESDRVEADRYADLIKKEGDRRVREFAEEVKEQLAGASTKRSSGVSLQHDNEALGVFKFETRKMIDRHLEAQEG